MLQTNIHVNTAAHICLSQLRKPSQMEAVYLQGKAGLPVPLCGVKNEQLFLLLTMVCMWVQ